MGKKLNLSIKETIALPPNLPDQQIDPLVYERYGLTEKEIRIAEGERE